MRVTASVPVLSAVYTYAPGEGRLADESLREKFIGLILGLVL